ncbi:MAG TPA: ABC transporter ATP-binding protein, partial [Ktedonobacterales bacterium]|nr:ABC transporter ATP-binding protein [Ktedonobacterales bacterium]
VRQLGLESWLVKLPHGLDTMLAAGGGGLSAGEAQLLAFIRIFLRDPGVVVLDEPSSRLDPATERLIERGMAGLLRGRTGIIIAHRLATVERADTILVLDGGHVVEYGPRVALAQDPTSRYAALLEQGREEVLA